MSDVDKQRENLREGRGLDNGFCFNPDRDPDIYKCSEEEQRIATGEISVSWDGRIVTDLKTGEVTRREQPKEYAAMNVRTAADMADAGLETAGGDTVTTDNAPAGGRTRTARATT